MFVNSTEKFLKADLPTVEHLMQLVTGDSDPYKINRMGGLTNRTYRVETLSRKA